MRKKKRLYLVLCIALPFIILFIEANLYNRWFDTYDKIKYDFTYSPELNQDKTVENIIYWGMLPVFVTETPKPNQSI
jgi:hypothetical protein